jgi:hypothetical protein
MNEDQEERLVTAFEQIGKALSGIHEEAKHAGVRYWPQPREFRETIVTRVETDEEREKRQQGGWRRTADQAINPEIEDEEAETIGPRSRQWIREHPPERNKKPAPPNESAKEGE